MKQRILESLPRLLFLLSLVFLSYAIGLFSGIKGLPPSRAITDSVIQIGDLAQHWQNDLGLTPTRLLVEGYADHRERFVVIDESRMASGDRLIAGLTADRSELNGVMLFDQTGRELHYWPIHFERLEPNGRAAENVFMHGLAVLPDGSLIVNFDGGGVLARVDACGETLWATEGSFHHAATRALDGAIWTLTGQGLAKLDIETGKIIRKASLEDAVIFRHHRQGIFGMRTEEAEHDYVRSGDTYHLNHIEALSPAMASAFPGFEAGDLLISARSLNLVAVLDQRTLDLKWWSHGPWHRQHDPHFLSDGHISVYNNNMAFDRSQIVAIDPRTNATEVLFEGSEAAPFYSWRRGKHQHLPNGNILITESEKGRVFEVTAAGDLVWEFNNVYDETRNGVLNAAFLLPSDYFDTGALSCD